MRNRMYGGVRGRKTKVGEKLLRFPPTRFLSSNVCLNPSHYLNHHHHHPNLYRASTSFCHASTSCRACDACDACLAFLVHKLHEFRLAIPVFRSCTQGNGGACRVPSYA